MTDFALFTRMDSPDVFIEGVGNEYGQVIYRAYHRPTGVKVMIQDSPRLHNAERWQANKHTLLKGLEKRITEYEARRA